LQARSFVAVPAIAVVARMSTATVVSTAVPRFIVQLARQREVRTVMLTLGKWTPPT